MEKREDGFTLLEVLVAFVILTSALGVLYQILLSGGLRADTARLKQGALLLARNKLSEAPVLSRDAEGREGSYHWRIEWRPQTLNSARERRNPVQLAQVTVAVTWGEGDSLRELRLQTLRPETYE